MTIAPSRTLEQDQVDKKARPRTPGAWARLTVLALQTGRLCLLTSLVLTRPSYAQAPLSGTWVAVSQTLDNGELNKVFFDLHQNGRTLTGRFHSFGWGADLTGTIEDGNFKVYAAYNPAKVFASGKVDGSNLDLVMNGNQSLILKPAESADEPAALPYLTPPALHPVPRNGLALTPPMGWNSWNKFAGGISDAIVRQVADAMVSSGMRDAGYVYLNIDDTWEGVRDQNGVLQPNHKFPDMKALAGYVHSKGLKLGIYSSPGPRTCGGYPGSYGHEQLDAKTWASWGIDYLKYDWCSAETVYKEKDLQPIYQKMGDALHETNRPIVYSLCEYGMGHVETWGADVGANLWRTTGDIRDEWHSMSQNGFSQSHLAPYAGPGHWNDPDMLEVGNGKMTDEEYRTHMSLWSLLASPLLAGNDVRSMSQATKDILLNPEVIAIDQDALGRQGQRLFQNGDEDVWTKPLADGGLAVGVFNRGEAAKQINLTATDLKLPTITQVRDLWTHRSVIFASGSYSALIPSHGVLLLRLPAGAHGQP